MIGIIPCGGKATRIHGLPKYLLPCPGGFLLKRLVDQMAFADRVIVLSNKETAGLLWQYAVGNTILVQDRSSMADAIYAAKNQCDNEGVVVGMPDTYWTDPDILTRLASSAAVISVALWHVEPDQRHKLGMCAVEEDRIVGLVDKPAETTLEWAWGALAWSSHFWQYIQAGDAHMGVAIQRAIDAGVYVRAVYASGPYFDCGTPNEYFAMIREVTP